MGVFPLVPDPARVNRRRAEVAGLPTADQPDIEMATLFAAEGVRRGARAPEAPLVIINHPRGARTTSTTSATTRHRHG